MTKETGELVNYEIFSFYPFIATECNAIRDMFIANIMVAIIYKPDVDRKLIKLHMRDNCYAQKSSNYHKKTELSIASEER